MPTVVVLCPFVHRPSFDAMFQTLHPALRDGAMVLDNTVTNLGAAGSRNVGAKRVLEQGADWLMDISPVTRFGPAGGMDFLHALDIDAWVMQSAAPVNWHVMGWSRRLFERVGLFDENFWPIHGEDGDMSYRIHTAIAQDGIDNPWRLVETDAWITMYGHSQKLAAIFPDHEAIRAYYATKWGGWSGSETYTHPFDNPAAPLSYWPRVPARLRRQRR